MIGGIGPQGSGNNDEINLDYMINGVNTSEFYSSCDYYSYDNLNDINFVDGSLKILHLNVWGLANKITDLQESLALLKNSGHCIDILLLCETFMNSTNIRNCKIKGFTLIARILHKNWT